MWKPKHKDMIRRNFHTKASYRLCDMFVDARKTHKKPRWLGDGVSNRVLAHCNTKTFHAKSAQDAINRASEKGGTLHTDGSISMHDHAMCMATDFGCYAHIDEVFQQIHIRNDTEFQRIYSQARSKVASSGSELETSPLDSAWEESIRSRCWTEAVGGKTKG
ncbi:hypothetical protein JHK82_018727 [Glycine max]|nr:hypothetical protein JHK85_019169 [Glycine max]KAG5037910.1 hypothetical protein JHK86_018750 [Glycine max]KAG5143032.1 hypothetical protein JHK82_018727 [Glycine max]